MANMGRYEISQSKTGYKDNLIGAPRSRDVIERYRKLAQDYKKQFPYQNDFHCEKTARQYLMARGFTKMQNLYAKLDAKAWITKYRDTTGKRVWVSYF